MNETTPKISVIVPVYKAENYLHRCVDSLLAQTFQDFEILLVDDGSPDRSGEICDEYAKKDERVRVFHKENGGVSSARNLGLDHAVGEYICFVDSDDWVEKEMFTTLTSSVQNRKNLDILFFGFQYEFIDVDRKLYSYDKCKLKNICSETKEEVLSACFFLEKNKMFGWTWNKLFRRELIEDEVLRFDETISLQEDHLFTLNYIRYANNLQILAYYPYHYRILSNSLMKRKYSYLKNKEIALLLLHARLSIIGSNISLVAISYLEYTYQSFLMSLSYNLTILYSSYLNFRDRKDEILFYKKVFHLYFNVNYGKRIFLLYLLSLFPAFAFDKILDILLSTRKISRQVN